MVYFINLNSFYYSLTKSVTFVKIVYGDSVSYLFPHFDNGLSSLTMAANATTLHNLDEILSNSSNLLSLEEALQNPDLKAKIETHCPPNIGKEAIHEADQIKATIKTAGQALNAGFKYLGSLVAQGVNYVGEFIDKKV